MTVEDLIELLREMPQTALVEAEDEDGLGPMAVLSVSYDRSFCVLTVESLKDSDD